jgi:hypothetical protein
LYLLMMNGDTILWRKMKRSRSWCCLDENRPGEEKRVS